MSQPRVYEWYKRFRKEQDVEDDARPGRHGTSITDENMELFITNSYHQAVPSIKSIIYVTSFTQPPYSPDLALCDFFLFPKLKRTLKRQRFSIINEMKAKSQAELKAIPKEAFCQCFSYCKLRWNKYIISQGNTSKGTTYIALQVMRHSDCNECEVCLSGYVNSIAEYVNLYHLIM